MEHGTTGTGTGTVSANGHDATVGTSPAPPAGRDGEGARTEGSADEATAPSTRPPGPSVRMALIVLAIAVTLTVVGSVASGLTGGHAKAPASAPRLTTAKGSPLPAMASAGHLGAITEAGMPPNDVVQALALPHGSTVVPGSAVNSGVGLYDRTLGFVVRASETDVIRFFRAQLPADLWHVLSSGAASGAGTAPGSYRVIAQHPSSDGYEWEIGITVMPETFTSTSPAAASAGSTPFTLRLFEVSDDD